MKNKIAEQNAKTRLLFLKINSRKDLLSQFDKSSSEYKNTLKEISEIKNQIFDLNKNIIDEITEEAYGDLKETSEDLMQLASEGLLLAIEGFKLNFKGSGNAFLQFSVYSKKVINRHLKKHENEFEIVKDNKISKFKPKEKNNRIDFNEKLKEYSKPFDIEERLIAAEKEKSILSALYMIDPQIKIAIAMRTGLLDGKIYTYKEISQILGISEDQVRNKFDKGIRNLTHPKYKLYNYKNDEITSDYTITDPINDDKIDINDIFKNIIDIKKMDFDVRTILAYINLNGIEWNMNDLRHSLNIIDKIEEKIDNSEEAEKIKDDIKKIFNIDVNINLINYIKEKNKKDSRKL